MTCKWKVIDGEAKFLAKPNNRCLTEISSCYIYGLSLLTRLTMVQRVFEKRWRWFPVTLSFEIFCSLFGFICVWCLETEHHIPYCK